MTRQFTGRHIALILIGFFGVVITVNLIMAREASSTFGGVVVENSYVASQHFNRWLDEAAKEKTLGWQAEAKRQSDGRIVVSLSGAPLAGATLTATARHPLGYLPDVALVFVPAGEARFISTRPLPEGRWRLRLDLRSGGQNWRSEEDVS